MDLVDPTITETTHDSWNDFMCDITHEQNELILLHVNIRSMIKNHSQLEYIVAGSPLIIHLIIITEANISDSISTLFDIKDYVMYTELRKQRKGGGIIIYAHKSISFIRTSVNTLNFECLCGEVESLNGHKTFLCSIYRPPSWNKNDFVIELSQLLSAYPTNKNCILVGDTNIDTKCINNTVRSYLNSLNELGFECCISQFTRVESNVNGISKSCIDHLFVRGASRRGTLGHSVRSAVVRDALADHYVTGLALSSYDCVNSYKTVNKLNNEKIKQELSQIDWSSALGCTEPNEVVDFIIKKYQAVYSKCTYQTKINQYAKSDCNWISDKLINMCNKKKELLKIFLNDTSNKQNELIYKKYRNRTNRMICNARNNLTKREICNNFKNPKKMWEIINRLTGRIIKAIDDVLVKSFRLRPKQLSDKFAHDFDNNVKNVLNTCDRPLLDEKEYIHTPSLSLRLGKINEEVLHRIIRKINDKKSPGYDTIRAKDVKYISEKITPVLMHLINLCISQSTYPDQLKIGLVRPIHKKGSHTDTNNYRPITILSCLDKIIEKYIGNSVNNFLSSNGLIHVKQFGFQKRKSTSQLLSLFTDEINSYLDKRYHVLTVMIDFSKAFDTLNYKTLYQKMQQNGIQGPVLELMKNYHTNRYNAVSIAGELSDLIPTLCGTAQGSILGPTEYLLYVNDMCKIFRHGSVYQFADDTCITTAHQDLEMAQSMMQEDFDLLCKWAHDLGLSINYSKTKLMHIHSPYKKTNFIPAIVAHEHNCMHLQSASCNCVHLDLVQEHTYLGLKIDHRFNWGPHIEHVCNKLRSILSKLCVLRHKVPYNTLRLLYMSLADSVISYGLASYGRTFKTSLNHIYNLQLRLLKAIVPAKIKYKYKNNYENLFNYCKVMNVFDKLDLAIVIQYNENIPLLKKKKRPVNLRNLPYLSNFEIPTSKNEYGQRVWQSILPRVLNRFPIELVSRIENKTCQQTKNIIKRYLFKPTSINVKI